MVVHAGERRLARWLPPFDDTPPAGTVVAWGDDTYGQTAVPPGLTGVVRVSAGQFHSLALKSDGTVVAWGRNDTGQGVVPPGLTGVVAISTHRGTNLALRSNGTVVAWGNNNNGQATVPVGVADIVAVSSGSTHSLALRDDGTVIAWGSNLMGQTDVPPGLTGVVEIAAGAYHSAALVADGTVVAWGRDTDGEAMVPSCLPVAAGVAVTRYTSFALLADGTVFGWGSNRNGEATIPSVCGVTALSGGAYHLLAVHADGRLVAWGSNVDGQLDTPPGLGTVIDAAAGFYHSVAVATGAGLIPTTTTVATGPHPSVYQEPVTVTATVAPAPPASETPTGDVVFFVDGFSVDIVPVGLAGTAATTLSTPEAGQHPVFAVYQGDAVFAVSASDPVTHQVDAGKTTTTLTSGPNPSTAGQPVVLTATVAAVPPSGGVPAGTVTFIADSVTLATVPVSYLGEATTTTSGLAVGTHTLQASFVDSFRRNASTASPVTHQVLP
ncbi:MAG TPA: Ig-like domain repeat protein [Amycolatopsis sp.]|nr:Ig-like domain repeat protein [Amycolatopsis sp.]